MAFVVFGASCKEPERKLNADEVRVRLELKELPANSSSALNFEVFADFAAGTDFLYLETIQKSGTQLEIYYKRPVNSKTADASLAKLTNIFQAMRSDSVWTASVSVPEADRKAMATLLNSKFEYSVELLPSQAELVSRLDQSDDSMLTDNKGRSLSQHFCFLKIPYRGELPEFRYKFGLEQIDAGSKSQNKNPLQDAMTKVFDQMAPFLVPTQLKILNGKQELQVKAPYVFLKNAIVFTPPYVDQNNIPVNRYEDFVVQSNQTCSQVLLSNDPELAPLIMNAGLSGLPVVQVRIESGAAD